MKIKRYKKVNRILRFYALHFGFRKPYQILIDGTICATALKNKINLNDQLTKYLDGDVRLVTTTCIVKETEALGLYGASLVVKQFALHQCGHQEPVSGSQCIIDMIEISRYLVATQDRELQHKCRKRVGVPLIYLHITTPTLEAPSLASQKHAEYVKKETCSIRPQDQLTLTTLKGKDHTISAKRPRKKRPLAPNPLSCKKKKYVQSGDAKGCASGTNKNKKRTKRKKTQLEKKILKEMRGNSHP